MSKFYASGFSDSSESESDTSADESFSDSEQQKKNIISSNRWALAESDSDDEEEREVLSLADRRLVDLKESLGKLKNYFRINDINKAVDEFNTLQSLFENSKEFPGTREYLLQGFIVVEDGVKRVKNDISDSGLKLSQSNKKSLKTLNQRIKKVILNNLTEIEAYRANNKDIAGEESELSEDEVVEKKKPKVSVNKEKQPKTSSKFFASSSESESESESEDSSDESDTDYSKEQRKARGISFWMKKQDDSDDERKKKPKKKTEKTAVKVEKLVEEEEEKKEEVIVWSDAVVEKKLREIVKNRGRRGINKEDEVEKLRNLFDHASSMITQTRVNLCLITALYDLNSQIYQSIPWDRWNDICGIIISILDNLEKNKDLLPNLLIMSEKAADSVNVSVLSIMDNGKKEEEMSNNNDMENTETENNSLFVDLVYLVVRLDRELTQSYRSVDSHTEDYLTRLQDEKTVLDIATRSQILYEDINEMHAVSRLALLRVQHMSYHLGSGTDSEAHKKLLFELIQLVYKYGSQKQIRINTLNHVYFLALSGNYYEARDLLLMVRVQDFIRELSIDVKIMYNRTIAQLGICAFRKCMLYESYICLDDLFRNGKCKDLLGQGVSKGTDRDKERAYMLEMEQRRYAVPFHKHVNMDLLEAAFLISSTFLELPYLVLPLTVPRPKNMHFDKYFNKLFETSYKNTFNGPPEGIRDTVIDAAKYLYNCEWRKSEEILTNLSCWAVLDDETTISLIAMLREECRKVCLQLYLIMYGPSMVNIRISDIVETFDIPESVVMQVVSKCVLDNQFQGLWDEPTKSLHIFKSDQEMIGLQTSSFWVADKIAHMVKTNESIFISITGLRRDLTGKKEHKGDKFNQQKDKSSDRTKFDKKGRNIKSGQKKYAKSRGSKTVSAI